VPTDSEADAGEREDQSRQEDRRRRADPTDERHDDRARDARADEVGEIQPPDLIGLPGEERGDHHPDRDERREQRQADAEQEGEVLERRQRAVVPQGERVGPDCGDDHVSDGDAGGAEQQAPPENRLGLRAAEAP